MRTLPQNLRFGLRMLAKTPGFTAIAVLTLALGIGANTAIFSIADAFLLRPISLPVIDRLAMIAIGQKAPAATADFVDWKSESHSFGAMAAYRMDDINLTGAGVPERVFGSRITSNFFSTAGVKPVLGRDFLPEEDQAGHEQVVILSYGVWQQRFAGDAGVLGRAVEIDGKASTIIGVMPQDFDYPVPSDLWVPLAMDGASRADRKDLALHVLGRLNPRETLAQAQSEMTTIGRRLEQAYPETNKNRRPHVMSVVEYVEGSITRSFTFLFLIAVGFVLLIACSNIANLQLARLTSRQKEIAVRTALGASRWRILRLLLVENVLMALLGGACSVAFATWVLNLIASNMPADIARLIPGWYEIRLDNRALLFTLAIAILSGVVAGIIPAFSASRTELNESLKEGGRGSTAGYAKQRVRSAFVIAQMALALALLVGAGLMVKGFRGLVAMKEASAPEHVLTLAVNLPEARYETPLEQARFYRQVIEKLRSIPGAEQAAAFTTIPLSNNGTMTDYFQIEGHPFAEASRGPWAVYQHVSAGYLGMMRIPLIAGRDFTDADREDSQPVAIVNQRIARQYWPEKSAIGQHVKAGGADEKGPWLTVVGVADDVLYDWTNQVPEPTIYVPHAQSPLAESLLAIRTTADPGQFAQAARGTIASLDPELPAFSVMPLADAIHESIVGLEYSADMMASVGLLALIIAIVGIYGVMSYSVAERTHEIGVRMALGGQRRDILWLVSRRGAGLLAAALAIGLPLAIGLARLMSGLIYGASAMDVSIFAGVTATLSAIALIASYIPARRAMRTDPMEALRYE